MKRLEEQKQQLKALQQMAKTDDITKLRKLEIASVDLRKSFVKMRKYLRKQRNSDLSEIKDLIRKVDKVNGSIVAKIIQLNELATPYIEPKNPKAYSESPEIEEANRIMRSDYDEEKKIELLKKLASTYDSKVEKLKEEQRELKRQDKEAFDAKIFSKCHEIEGRIKNNEYEIRYYQNIVGRCKTFIAQLNTKNQKIKYPKNKRVVEKGEKENKNYYSIIYALLNDDRNYLIIKELIKENKKFVNARYEGKHIIFEILDKYIYNLKRKLVNQKLLYINPRFFYNLLNLYLHEDLDLSIEERKCLDAWLKGLKDDVNEKKHVDTTSLIAEIDSLLNGSAKIKEESLVDTSLYEAYLKQIMGMAMQQKNRVSLTEEHLLSIYEEVAEFREDNRDEEGKEFDDNIVAEKLNLPVHDVKNSRYRGITIALDNKKYAFSIGYDDEYNIYFRIHVLDTTFIEEDSIWYQEMKNSMTAGLKKKSKTLRFSEGNTYPAMTYQLKIFKNGTVGSFKAFMSTIEINKSIKNIDLLNYRMDPELKGFIGCLKHIANNYDADIDFYSIDDIENLIDYALNIELKDYFDKNKLPSLYFVEVGLSDAEKERLHYDICYNLGHIPKKEAHTVFDIVTKTPASRVYSDALVDEAQIELNSKTFIGYNNLLVLRAFLNNRLTEETVNKYKERFRECENMVNKDDLYTDYLTGKKLNRKQDQ